MARISRKPLATVGALLTVPILAAILLTFPGRSVAQAPETFTVVSTFERGKVVDLPRKGVRGVGDSEILRLRLTNDVGSRVGVEVDHCVVVHLQRQLCDSAFYISGRGRLVAEGIWNPAPGTVNVFAVAGGTGDFAGARGTVEFSDLGEGRVQITFTLMP